MNINSNKEKIIIIYKFFYLNMVLLELVRLHNYYVPQSKKFIS